MSGIIFIYKKPFLESQKDQLILEKVKKNSPEIYEQLYLAQEAHFRSVELFYNVLDKLGIPYAAYERSEEAGDLERASIVVTLGGDGTFIHASHYLKKTPLLGFNSAVGFSVGHYCLPCPSEEAVLENTLQKIFLGKWGRKFYLRLQVFVNEKPIDIPVINDILISENSPATTSRYLLSYKGQRQLQKSSGIWIATPSGIGAGYSSAGGKPFFEEEYCCGFVVRELYSKKEFDISSGFLAKENLAEFQVISAMAQGRLFIDGSHCVFPFLFGDKLEIKIYPEPLISFETKKETFG